MRKESYSWYSPNLRQEMPIVSYGHYGLPLLMFPTAAADLEEYERFYVIDSIKPYIEEGRVKVFSINSINRESWLNYDIHPGARAWRQVEFDRYIAEEVVPFIWTSCNTPYIPITTTGASFGAFHAANTLFKHPDLIKRVIAMSGSYDIRSFTEGYYDENCYYNNPVHYLSNLQDEWYLDQLRSCKIYITTGQGAYEAPQRSKDLAFVLSAKGIPHELDLWGYDVPHDWPTWRDMMKVYIPRLFPLD